MPDFDTEYVHWRKRFDVPKQLDERDVKIEDLFAEKNVSKDEYVKKFLEVETREYIPKNNEIKPKFKEGERVYAKVKIYVKCFFSIYSTFISIVIFSTNITILISFYLYFRSILLFGVFHFIFWVL